MKQLYTKVIVSSALLVFSNLAHANNINFGNEADKIIDAELSTILESYSNSYEAEVNQGTYYGSLPQYFNDHKPANSPYYVELPGDISISVKRPISLSELSNSEVSFTNINGLGVYTEKIAQEYDSYPIDQRYRSIASYGSNGFTANFSQPVNNVNVDFHLTDYFWNGMTIHGYRSSIYPGFDNTLPTTPITLSATFRDATGAIIGGTTQITPFSLNLIDNPSQLNNAGFSIGSLKPFSSIDISWDAGSITSNGCWGGNYYDGIYCMSNNTFSNLLVADNFSYTFATAAVPEPETYAMFFAGLVIIGSAANKRKRMS